MMSVRLEKPELAERRAKAGEIVVGIADGGERRRAVDAGHQRIEAVALIMLRAIRIARPEHQRERLVALLEQRQDRPGRHVGEIVLLCNVRRQRAGRAHRSRNFGWRRAEASPAAGPPP